MTMPRLPYSDLSLSLAFLYIPLVFLWVWLFNSYRLGKIRRPVFIGAAILIILLQIAFILFFFHL
ncbi:MAG: hypothetical protein J6N32_08395 [Clostridia bacterium]|nr:hypothetical protein [Clostridia bacterium]MBP3293759.1 hypothetical protein [Clostridia bacterium]